MTILFRRLIYRNKRGEVMKTKIYSNISTPVLVIFALIIFGAANTKAAPGDLDPTFGSGGIVITRGSNLIHLFAASATAIQSDGKIIVVGTGIIITQNYSHFTVARYNTDGSLDTSFGGTGIVITPVGNFDSRASSVAIQSDGKIVAAGNSGSGGSFAIVRYNPNGSLDTSFGGTGIVLTPLSFFENYAYAVAIQPDGKIVAAGTSDNTGSYDFAIVRYNPNGSLDTSFGGGGIVFTQIENVSAAYAVAIQADGKIVAAGNSGNSHFAVVRYNPNGSLDTSFNGTGIVITSVDSYGGSAYSVAIQADGKIVTAGYSSDGEYAYFALVRYNPNGSLDTSFGGTGKIIISTNNTGLAASAASVVIQTDGKIVAAGYIRYGNSSFFAVVRVNPNGSLDTTFNGGIFTTPISNYQGGLDAVAIQADGKIVVAGSIYSSVPGDHAFALVRYQGNSNTNVRTRFDFDGDGRADISVFRPSDRIWYLNQSTQGFSATQFGLSNDKITPADYDGDGKTDISVYRDGTWYWLASSNNYSFNARQFGNASDIPVPADYTGDGRADLAVYRNGTWWIQDLTNNQTQVVNFGLSTDKPITADYDGDGRADQAVYRDGIWYFLKSTQGFAAIQFGLPTDKLVPADYDGDGKTDVAVYRAGTWYLLGSQAGFTAFQFGNATDVTAPADYDGDGKTDAAVYRNGVWYLRQSANGFAATPFGLANDIPVPSAFVP
jgi:uncharacterized delta-60 repeat protein